MKKIYEDETLAVKAIRDAQGTQRDMRAAVREAHDFTDKRDGQWEPDIISKMRGKPRYTDDRVNPIVNQIAGEMENAEFTIKVRPAGGEATKALAQLRDGLIRNIRNISNADRTFAQAGRKMVKGGFAAWLIKHDYFDDDSFDQDLLIEPIHDAHDRVWLDPADLSDDGSDAKWGVVLHYIPTEAFKHQFPKSHPKSLGNAQWTQSYYYKAEHTIIGHFYYLKEENATLLQMSDGKVLWADETTEQVLDDLALNNVLIEDSREVKKKVCYMRQLDAGGWLSPPERTVFDCIPIVPVYGNFEVSEGKTLYRGVVEKLMDMQRVHNYAVSRNIEEVALAPRKKIFMTREQAEGNVEQIKTLNTNLDPVQFYTAQGNVPPPYELQGAQGNPALTNIIEQSDQAVSRSAGLFAANMGDNTNLQSGVALDKQIDRGNNGTSVYFEAMETAICRTGYILNKAIPLVYDATRQVRIIGEDGTVEMAIMNNVVIDQATGTPVMLNDLSQGKYDVTCDVGQAYKNRQQEATDMFLRAAEKDPSLLQLAGDIWLGNINAPSFDKIAERSRAMALQSGMIPQEQLTEEELAFVQEQQAQPQEPDVNQIALEIEQMKAQTAMMVQQNKQTEHQIQVAELQASQQGEQQKLQSKLAVDSAKIQQTQERIGFEGMRVQMEQQNNQFKQAMEMMQAQNERLNSLTNALVSIKNATGADVIVNNEAAQAYNSIASDINEDV